MKCSKCQRDFQDYYEVKTRFPANHTVILCYDCWKSISDNEANFHNANNAKLDALQTEHYMLNRQLDSLDKDDYECFRIKERLKAIEAERQLINNNRRQPYYLLNTAKYHSDGNSSSVRATAPKTSSAGLGLSQLDQVLTNMGISATPADNAPGADINSAFPDASVFRHNDTEAVFQGRNLPSYVKDYILRRYSDSEGKIDASRLKEYLEAKMPADSDSIKNRILRGEQINVTARVVFKPDLAGGRITFELPDLGITSDAKVARTLIDEKDDVFFDGEQWGNLTILYVEPKNRQKGFVEMISYKPFQPYTVNLDYFRKARRNFSLEQWIDALVGIMGYDASKLKSEEVKLEYVSRLLPFVEPFLNMIELGPKSTGKSHLYNNLSKRGWCISGGKITRAKLFYNKSNHKFGLLKHYDVVSIDEISTFVFGDSDEMQSAFKSYLEAGKCTIDNTTFLSDCGLVLMGNIPLDENKQPLDSEFYKVLPVTLRESATLDRFHGFIEGWKLPRLEIGLIHKGWTLDSEYFSSVLHSLRSEGEYSAIFDEIVSYDARTDLRDLKAVKKIATAYTKILFPHVRSINQLTPQALARFKATYERYCLAPAISRRGIIRKQCHSIDSEFSSEMPDFKIK